MAKGMPVSYREDEWLKYALAILGTIALLGGAAIIALGKHENFSLGAAIGGVGLSMLAGGQIVAFWVRSARRSVIDTGHGFRWLGGPAELEVEDSQIIAVRLKRTNKFAAGVFKAVVRRFEVWTDDSPVPLCMSNRVVGHDPLESLIARIVDDLKQRTAAGLAGGATLEGEGWRLATMRLSIGSGRTVRHLPFGRIEKTALCDGKLCLWLEGEDEPAAKIDPGSKNVPVLGLLLAEWIEHQEKENGHDAVSEAKQGEMGRLMFERRRYEGLMIGVVLGIIGGAIGVGLLCDRNTMHLGVLVIAAGAAALVLGLLFGRYVFRCYELGLIRRRGRNELRMRYADIVQFDYGATRMFHNGAYTGTSFSLAFRSSTAKIRYAASVKNPDADLDQLRDHIAKVVAGRMLSDLREGKSVPWGTDVVFRPEGAEFRRTKKLGFGQQPAEVLPYGRISGTNLQQGIFYLFSIGDAHAVLSKPVASPNFFPGFYLLLTLLDIAKRESKQAQSTPVEEAAVEGTTTGED